MKTAVLKFGGDVVADTAMLLAVLRDVQALAAEGWRFVLVHGGGPQASALQARLGLQTRKVAGRRVTDESTLQVMTQVLAGEVSVSVLAAARAANLRAVGLSGVSDVLVSATRRPPIDVPGESAPVDFGLVGEIVELRAEVITHLWEGGFTPVVNSLGVAPESDDHATACAVFNINADTVASTLAAHLGVDHLFLMTGVPGVLRDKDDPTTRIARLTPHAAQAAIAAGVIVDGMIPKVEEAFARLEQGISAVHILGAGPGDLAGEARNPGARGTALVRE